MARSKSPGSADLARHAGCSTKKLVAADHEHHARSRGPMAQTVGHVRTLADTAHAYAWLFGGALRVPKRKPEREPRRHLLLLAWAFPPEITGGTYRPAGIVRYALRRGWSVTVVAGPHPQVVGPAGRYLLDYVGTGARLFNLAAPRLRPSHRFFPRVSGGLVNAPETARIAAEQLAGDPPGVVVASGPPFHNFIAARNVGKRLGVPYVLDYRDEWTESPFGFVERGNYDRFFEKRCLRDAAAVVFTTEAMRQHQLRAFPGLVTGRSMVVPNGWEPADLATEIDTSEVLPQVPLRIAFLGNLSDHTSPAGLLQVLEVVLRNNPDLRERLRVTFVGHKGPAATRMLAEFPYQDNLELIEQVAKPGALAIMRSVDVLLLVNDVQMHRYRPGKIYDYLAAGTPVIVLGTGGEIAALVQRLDAGWVLESNDANGLAEILAGIGAARCRPGMQGLQEWLAEHTRQAVSERFIDVLEDVINHG